MDYYQPVTLVSNIKDGWLGRIFQSQLPLSIPLATVSTDNKPLQHRLKCVSVKSLD